MENWLFINSVRAKDLGLLLIRIGIGSIFVRHGYGKLLAGQEQWAWLGSQMKHIGITFIPVFWGFCAAAIEFFGGISVLLGLALRINAFLMALVMIIAVLFHFNKGDNFTLISHPLSLLCIFIGLMVAGAGRYSVDYYFHYMNR